MWEKKLNIELIIQWGSFIFFIETQWQHTDETTIFTFAGLEALERALCCWEDALTAFSTTVNNETPALPTKANAAFTKDVQALLDLAYEIQSNAELLFIDQVYKK